MGENQPEAGIFRGPDGKFERGRAEKVHIMQIPKFGIRPRSLSQRLFLVVAFALLPSALIVIATFFILRQDADHALNIQAQQTAELEALQLEQIMSGAENVLRTITVADMLVAGDSATDPA